MTHILIKILIPILSVIESGNDPNAIGDTGRSIGIMQIQKIVIDDINSRKGIKFTYDDRKDPEKSRLIAYRYLMYWGYRYILDTGKAPTTEVLARIWNGGPNGWKKKSTEKYWEKVKLEMLRRKP